MLFASLGDAFWGMRSLVLRTSLGSLALRLLPDEVAVVDGHTPADDDDGENKLNDTVNERGGVQATLGHPCPCMR